MPILEQLQKWINENIFTVQGKKYLDNDEFIKQVKKLERTTEFNAIKRASYLLNNVLDIKGVQHLKKGRGKKVKELGEVLKNNSEFSKAYKDVHGAAKIADLTNDQLNTMQGTVEKLSRHRSLIPKNAVTETQFGERIGLSWDNIKSLRGVAKDSGRGKVFNHLFKPVVIPNKATYYDATNLAKRIKEYKNYMAQGYVAPDTLERAVKFKDSNVIQKFLDNKNTDLWTKAGRTKALNILGKGTTPYQASYAISTLARAYDGDAIRGLDVKPNKAKAKFIFESLANLQERDPWSAPVYNQGLRQVSEELKGVGNFRTFKDTYTAKMNEMFDDMKIPKKYRTSINEIVSVKGAYRNKMAPYAAFVDLTRSDLNSYIAKQQGDLSKAMSYLDEHKKDFEKFKRKIKLFNEQTNIKRLAGITKKFGPEAAEQVNLASLVEGTDVERVYNKADLDRWKEKGLDLRKYAREKGYFLDVKGARPFFEVTIADLKKAVAGLGEKDKLRYCSLLARGGLPGDCAAAIENDLVKSSRIFSEAPATSGAMAKVKNIAKGFLGALGRFGPAAGKFGAIAAVGALAQPLVKQFMNDDPSTYLTDPDQQAGMLEELIERQERTKPRSEILDWSTTGAEVGAAASAVPGSGALWKARRAPFKSIARGIDRPGMGVPRAAMGPVMKFISGAYTPAGLLAHEPLRIAQMRREGESWGEVAKSPTLWMGPAFADTMTRMATRGMKKGSKLAKALSLGMSRPMLKTISRRFGMPGLALSAGLSGYDTYKDWKNKRGWFSKDEE